MLFIFNELRTATAAATSDKLGEILLREGLITQDQLKKALLEQKNTGMRLGYNLVKLGFVEETEISKMLARQYRMPAVDLSRFEVDPKILKLLPPDVANKHTVLPLKREGRTLTVAIADRSEEHTSELQSRLHLVCRLLLEKKKRVSSPTPVLQTR